MKKSAVHKVFCHQQRVLALSHSHKHGTQSRTIQVDLYNKYFRSMVLGKRMKRISRWGGWLLAAYISSACAAVNLPPPGSELKPLPQPAPSNFVQYKTRTYGEVRGGDTVLGHRLIRLKEADAGSSYTHPFEPVMDAGIAELPNPEALILSPKKLTLRDAIALALRDNPAVKISELQRILDKFGLEIAIHNYGVVWNPFTLTSTIQNQTYPEWTAGGGFQVTAPSGTNVSITHTNNLLGGLGNTQIQLTQPFLQNFGFAYNRIPYQNALDTEQINRLNFKNSVMSVVVSVISDYRSLVAQYNSLANDKKSLADQEASVKHTELRIKIGQMAPSDLLQQEENLEATRLTMVQQENQLRNAYLTFLTTLGMTPSTKFSIDRHISILGERVPSMQKCIAISLRHNVSYRIALLQLNITKRALITANNARKWTLNMVADVHEGSERTAVGEPVENISTNPSLEFSLSVPFDNISLKQGVVSAKIAIEDAKLNLEQQKETLVRNIMNQWESIHNQYEQIIVAQQALNLQIKTLENAKLKLEYGQSSVFEVNTLQTDLLTQQNSFVSTEIAYLDAITALYQTMGITLEKWNIKLRY